MTGQPYNPQGGQGWREVGDLKERQRIDNLSRRKRKTKDDVQYFVVY